MNVPSEQNWLVLVKLLTDLKKKGYEIPDEHNSDLALARSSINFYKKDPTNMEMINALAKSDIMMNEIQESLLAMAEQEGEEYINEWLDLLSRSTRGEEVFKMPQSRSKFLINAPPGMSSGRITLKKPLAEERVQEIAEWNGLIIEFDDDYTVALYGDKNNVQDGLKEMGPFFSE
ncbi:MAG: DUF2096 domain-containing protein [Methanobrevibacter sp.]|nr:DUF2096 domain-containing protein [Methanobrevibacter sp.]